MDKFWSLLCLVAVMLGIVIVHATGIWGLVIYVTILILIILLAG